MKTKIRPIFLVIVTLFALASGAWAQDKPITITIPVHVTPAYEDLYSGVEKFVNQINKNGKGKVEVKLYHSEKLYKVKDIIPALMSGSCEIIFHTSTHTTGSWPEIGGLSLPLLYKNEADALERWRTDGELMKLMNQEMDRKYGVRVLAVGILPYIRIWTVNKKIEIPEDVKGLKIRATGKTDAEAIHAFGGSPNFLSSAELYEALKRGTIDGMTTYPGTILARRLDEVIKYGINMEPIFCAWGYQIYTLNKTFNRWPKEVQNIILQAAQDYDRHTVEFSSKLNQEKIFPAIAKKIQFVTPSPEAMKKFEQLAVSTYQTWIKEVDKSFADKFIELSKAPVKK
jgi:TRAP-type C4-dicarboxylate transport system substrate-binding protein